MFDAHVHPPLPPLPVFIPPGIPITPCCLTVLIGGIPAARVGDVYSTCAAVPPAPPVPAPDPIILGSFTVLTGGQPQARIGDTTALGGKIIMGCFTVLVG
jgi:uncharacterized Zn-binding protein involved in type VI secretion